MSDYEYRNKTFDYAPPSRAGSAGGLLFVGAIILLFIVGMLFFGAGGGENVTPADTDGTPAVTAPATDSTPVAPAPSGQ